MEEAIVNTEADVTESYRLYRNTSAQKVSYILKKKQGTSNFWTTVKTFTDRFVAYTYLALLAHKTPELVKVLEGFNFVYVEPVVDVEETTEDNTEDTVASEEE